MKLLKLIGTNLVLVGAVHVLLWTPVMSAQESRTDSIVKQQEEKSKNLQPEMQERLEQVIEKIVEGGWFFSPTPRGLYPYFDSVYSGGGFTLGAGYRGYFGDDSFAEVRGLYSFKNYKRIEFRTATQNHSRNRIDFYALGGWMDATQIPYYGLGIDTTRDFETNFRLQQTYARGGTILKPVKWFRFQASTGYDKYSEKDGEGTTPTVGDVYSPDRAPALNVDPSYVRTEAIASIVTAPAEGYARRGGIFRFTLQDYRNLAGELDNFQVTRAEAVQHIPILRETWVLSFRGRLESAHGPYEDMPYYLLPWLGSGSTLRAFGTGRFRDKHSLLMSGEWRWIPNRFSLDMAFFCDAGTVAPRFKDLHFSELKYSYGVGIRFHGPAMTPLRFDVAHGNEGFHFVISSSAPF